MSRHPLYGLALAILGALILTPDTLFMRLSGMAGPQMLAWRGLLAGTTMMLAWMLFTNGTRRRDIAGLFTGAGLLIVLSQGINGALFSIGIGIAPVSVVLFGVATVPVFAALLAHLILGERTGRATRITIALVLAGIALAVFGTDDGTRINTATALGGLAGLAVAAVMAFTFVMLRANPFVPILPAIGGGALLSGLIGVSLSTPGTLTDGTLWAIALTGIAILPASFFLLSLASRYTQAANVSLLLLLETVLGPIWVWLGTNEAPTRTMLAGGTVVVLTLAVYLMHRRRVEQRRAAQP